MHSGCGMPAYPYVPCCKMEHTPQCGLSTVAVLQVFFMSSSPYKFLEASRIIFKELISNLAFSLLGVAILSYIFLVHPLAALLVVAAIVAVDLLLFAEMWLFNIGVNTISVINLVMAVGLAVDYTLHIVHTYLTTAGPSRAHRAKETMMGVAAAVTVAVLSTLVGVIVLAGSSSEIIRTFFKLLLGTVIFGGLISLTAVPVILSMVGPRTCLRESDGDNGASQHAASAGANNTPHTMENGSDNARRSGEP
jgi:predicted RND superfamily exporter protein